MSFGIPGTCGGRGSRNAEADVTTSWREPISPRRSLDAAYPLTVAARAQDTAQAPGNAAHSLGRPIPHPSRRTPWQTARGRKATRKSNPDPCATAPHPRPAPALHSARPSSIISRTIFCMQSGAKMGKSASVRVSGRAPSPSSRVAVVRRALRLEGWHPWPI